MAVRTQVAEQVPARSAARAFVGRAGYLGTFQKTAQLYPRSCAPPSLSAAEWPWLDRDQVARFRIETLIPEVLPGRGLAPL
jgi:hypothetical protein